MPTTSGWMAAVAALVALAIGRFFGIIELFVIGVGLALSITAGLVTVAARRPRLAATRTIQPTRVTAGEPARAELLLHNTAQVRSAPVRVTEPVGDSSAARLRIGVLAAGDQVTAGYRIPTARRGRLSIGPTVVARHDLLGLASVSTRVTDVEDVIVAPPTVEVPMPVLGHGGLGRRLAAAARRSGPGEFHSLRDYVPGDDLRLVDWKASARSDDLVVRQHRTPDLQRCVVVLDRSSEAYLQNTGSVGLREHPQRDSTRRHAVPPVDAFELAIIIAASIVRSASLAGLTTHFRTGGGLDLSGPDVADRTLDLLATVEIGPELTEPARDPAEGLGLLVIVTSTPAARLWSDVTAIIDPTLASVGVFTDPSAHPTVPPSREATTIDAPTLESFRAAWAQLVGADATTARIRTSPR